MTNKRRANVILAAVALVFVLAAVLRYFYPDHWWSELLFYMAEAGLVGGLADWYAVTALFRHPLGIPGKHTAIVPRNRAKLIDGVVTMVETQLLPPETLKEKLAQAPLVDIAISWVDSRFPPGMLARRSWKWLAGLMAQLDFNGAALSWDQKLKQLLERTDITPYAGKGLRWLLSHGNIHLLLNKLVNEASNLVASPEMRAAILKILEEEKDKQLNEGGTFAKFLKKAAFIFAEESDALNLNDAADAIHKDIQNFVEDLKRHDHELRTLLLRMLGELADDLNAQGTLSASLAQWKDDVLSRLSFAPSIEAILGSVKQKLDEELETLDEEKNREAVAKQWLALPEDVPSTAFRALREWTEQFAERFWAEFKEDAQKKEWVEGYIKSLLNKLVDSEHHLIGQIVRDTLNTFTEERLIAFIEDKVGEDLSRIRINGSLVGAGLGAILYLLLHGVYEPLLGALGV
ncbi:uncharacterized membrane-anchored protein YjiN (DUF445 family) [Paenibacillus phyllosphaerae]|uniref:Uncharacterized membrane-anchored protein YjiN (DUF445 family) n=1 Tax=Paenibacillus phyllosphaerae TaxID=274593 RepID=A0A7W5FRN6_9BACL|nr:DUF445 domain-containing protein [Paenibacillus phyllosphaerae]MBB3114716.1 uncharacterized membrane-anchored protein YjiN (DUF445 family) [Paenibacillus phyllosphaerae]